MHFHRDMLAPCDSYGKYVLQASPRRSLHRLGAARLHFRARRACAVPVPHRRGDHPARKGDAGGTAARDREIQGDRGVHRADRISRDAAAYRQARHLLAAQMRIGRRDAAEDHLRCLAQGDRNEDSRWHRRHRDDAYLYRFAGKRGARRFDRQAGAGLCREGRRRQFQRGAARHHRAARGEGTDRLPLSRRPAPDQVCAEGLEFPRRHLRRRMPTAISGIRRAPTT